MTARATERRIMVTSSFGISDEKPRSALPCTESVLRAWYYDVTELYDARAFTEAMALLPWPERRSKVERFVFLKDKCLCLGAGLLCAHALRTAGARDLAMGYGAYGKPYLLNHPGIHFNVSHSGTIAACAVASEPVGIDVEECQPYDEGVARLCFTDDELVWLHKQDDADQAFVRLWTRKESYLKLLGCGLSKPANSFSAIPGTLPETDVRFCEYYLQTYAVCVCAREHIAKEASLAGTFGLQEVPSFASMVTEEP